MKYNPRYRPETCVSKDATRHHLVQPYLDVVKKRLVSTNGHCLSAVPVQVDEGDRSGPLPIAAAIAARKGNVKARKRLAVTGNAMYVREPDGKFPDVDMVIPKYRAGAKGTVTICFDPRYLTALAAALGVGKYRGVTLTFVVENGAATLDPIVVKTDEADDDAIAVLMPRRYEVRK